MFGFWVWLGWIWAEPADGQTTLGLAAGTVGYVGTPFVLAAAAVGWHVGRIARAPDPASRLLALTTAGRHGRPAEWGAAMRAEVAGLTDPRERRRFALGCTLAAVRTGWGRTPWVVGAALLVGSAAVTFAASRTMLAGGQGGILTGVLLPVPVLFGAGLLAARAGRSFRAGLETGLVALLAVLVGVLVVVLPEAVTWYYDAGMYIVDGDRPPGGILGQGDAMRDALRLVTFFYLLFNAPWPVIGAAVGAWRRSVPDADPVAPSTRRLVH
jgi:hypothetical protein